MELQRHLPEAKYTRSLVQLHSQSYLFDPTPNFPLLVAAKRYWDPITTCSDSDALTLIFSHGAGLTKETWEACIESMFLQLRRSNVKVNDMWCIDAPNHGEASWLNEQVLDWCYRPVFRQEDYAHAIHALISGLGTGVDVDFRKRRLVGVGHSMGTVSLYVLSSPSSDIIDTRSSLSWLPYSFLFS
jgi:pimeloyl-ACP methyl ester carboxylesterase